MGPQNIMDLYDENANDDNYFDLMQRICMEQQHTNESNAESIDNLNRRINSMNEQMDSLQLRLDRQRDEHLRDKERFAVNTAKEMNRLRDAIKNVGMRQQQQIKQTTSSYYGYLAGASSVLWKSKK